MSNEYKRLVFWLVFVIILIWFLNKIIKDFMYSAQKTKEYIKDNIRKPKQFYEGIALSLFNAFEGFDLQLVKESALNEINVLNDDEFTLVYNIFNHNYTSGSETLTTWVNGETVGIFWDTEPKTSYLKRAKKLGLG